MQLQVVWVLVQLHSKWLPNLLTWFVVVEMHCVETALAVGFCTRCDRPLMATIVASHSSLVH
jgi:hypothetical protein